LEFLGPPGGPGEEMQRYVAINGIPLPRLLDEAQRELREEALRQLWLRSLLALAIMAVITFGLAWLLAGRMLRPLHAITSTARRLSESTLDERIALEGPRDELKELADTFDDMLARLDTAFTAQRDFVANASHELRTPLTIIRAEIDVALSDPNLSPEELKEMGAAVSEAVERSEKLIDGLLVLARADSSPAQIDLDLSELAADLVAQSAGEADALGLSLELDLRPAPFKGDRALVDRMIGNLVENAIRHNTPQGWFTVKTRLVDDRAVLQVANSGPVLEEGELGRLFDRFYRPDRSRSRKTGGFGLGLSIVKSVVTAHGGTVELSAPAGGGLDVTVSLPTTPTANRGTGS
jgi:signal transduction histidine kinase